MQKRILRYTTVTFSPLFGILIEKRRIMSDENLLRYPVEAWDTLQHLFKVKKINDHTLHFAAAFSGQLNLLRLKRAVDAAAVIFPLIRCGFHENKGYAFWQDKNDTSEDIVSLIKTENPENSVMKFLCTEIDAVNGPQLQIGIIRCRESDTLCIKISHMLCDAAGFKDFLYLLSATYTGIEKNSVYSPLSAMRNRKIRQLMTASSFGDRLKIYFSRNDLSVHDCTEFHFEGNLKNPFIELRTMPRDQFCAMRAYAKSHGATVNDVILTAFQRVLFQIFGHTVAIPCANDLRKYLPSHKADGICNLITNINCDPGQDLGAAFDDTLIKVKSAMNKEKADIGCMKSVVLMELIFSILPYHMAKSMIGKVFSNPPIAFTNIGILDKKQLVFGTAEMTGAYMTGSIKYSPYFQLAISTFDNEATFSANLYGTISDRNQIASFLDKMMLELKNAV